MEKMCPLLQKPCVEHSCKFFVNVQGMHPQTGQIVDRFDCSFAWLPILLIENSAQQRQTAAAVESLRNVKANEANLLQNLARGAGLLEGELK